MQAQWHLCEIESYPTDEGNSIKKTNNLSVQHPTIFVSDIQAVMVGSAAVENNKKGEGAWYVWLPIIPRVGDALQFSDCQVQVSKVVLETDYRSKTGIQEEPRVSARISIRNNVVPRLTDASFSAESLNNNALHKRKDFARRGHGLQYFTWQLRHGFYVEKVRDTQEILYYRWHTRIRPITGDVITVVGNQWRVTSVELSGDDDFVDGYLSLEDVVG